MRFPFFRLLTYCLVSSVLFPVIPYCDEVDVTERKAIFSRTFSDSFLDTRIHRIEANSKPSKRWIPNKSATAYLRIHSSFEVECVEQGAVVSLIEPNSSLDLAIPLQKGIFRPISLGSSGVIINAFWLSDDLVSAFTYSEGRIYVTVLNIKDMTSMKQASDVLSNYSPAEFIKKYYSSQCANESQRLDNESQRLDDSFDAKSQI